MHRVQQHEGTALAGEQSAATALSQRLRLVVLMVTGLATVFLAAGVVATWRLGGNLRWSPSVVMALPAVAALGCGSYGFRFLRWHGLVLRVAPRLPLPTSLRIYMAGFSLGVTPGRFGELLKFALLRRATGIPEVESAAVLPIEGATEVLSFVLLAVVAATVGHFRLPELGLGEVLAGALLLVLLLLGPLRRLIAGQRRLRRPAPSFPRLQALVQRLLALGGLRPVLLALACALAARVCDATLFWTASRAAGLNLAPTAAALAWGLSGLVGGLSLLPGGVGVVEGSLVAAVVRFGGTASPALVAALLSRLVTLWLWIPGGLWLAARAGQHGDGLPGGPRDAAAVTTQPARHSVLPVIAGRP